MMTISQYENRIKYLEEENALLLCQIEREVDSQKPVVLPAKIARTLERFKNIGCVNADIIYQFASGEDKNNLDFAYYAADNFDRLLQALVNGYTVETLESKIRSAVLKLVEERSEQNVGYIIANDSEDFSQEITELVTRIIREDQSNQ